MDVVSNGSAAVAYIAEKQPQVILVDAASMRTNGKRICRSLRQSAPGVPLILVIEPKYGSADEFDANVVLVQPFTLQKLLNRIRPLVPNEEDNMLGAGPLQLNVEQRWVRCHDRLVQLTPRLVSLLKILMDHPGEVIERSQLFKQVWETTYVGDTRTLDVHVSWLRQAVEEDPRRPKLIKTVRGVGYRLDIEPDVSPKSRTLPKKR